MTAGRAIVRLAFRDLARSRWRSLLVGLLILLPVAAMVWGITIIATVLPTADAQDTHRMGKAELLVEPGPSEDRLRALFPTGTVLEPISTTSTRLRLPGTTANVTVSSMDLNGLARGIWTLVGGRQPSAPGEAAISPRVAQLAGVDIGGKIDLEGRGQLLVVGTVEDPWDIRGRDVLLDPSIARQAPTGSSAWLVALPPGVDPRPIIDAAEPDASGGPIQIDWRLGRGAIADSAGGTATGSRPTPAVVVLGALVLLESALVAAAAFAVSIRRRQRELGLLAAAGAEPRHLAGTVLGEGLLLGAIGAAGGAVVGLLAAAATWPWLDQLTDRRTPPLVIDPPALLAAAGVGVMAALVAAVVPAWNAARLPVLLALSGRRPPQSPARRFLRIGLVLIGLAAALTFGGASLSLARDRTTLPILLLAAGAMLGTLGCGVLSPWLLERLEGISVHLPLAGRIALRDTARARSRNAPIVTAVLASLAATIAIGAYAASRDAEIVAHWQPWLAGDQILIEGPDADRAGPDAAGAMKTAASSAIRGATAGQGGYARLEAPAAQRLTPLPSGNPAGVATKFVTQNVAIGDAALLRALGADSAAGDLNDGVVIILAQEPWVGLDHVTAIVNDGTGDAPGVVLPTRVIVTGVGGGDLPEAVIAKATATRLGLTEGQPFRFVIRLDHVVTDADMSIAAAAAAEFPDTFADASRRPSAPDEALRIVLILASLVFALTVTGIAVVLGEAESRPDQRTLLTLGAEPGLRRRITAARAGVLTLIAGGLAIPAGLLPVWGLLASRGAVVVIPVPEIAVTIGLLPTIAIVTTWIMSRPIPEWSAFRTTG